MSTTEHNGRHHANVRGRERRSLTSPSENMVSTMLKRRNGLKRPPNVAGLARCIRGKTTPSNTEVSSPNHRWHMSVGRALHVPRATTLQSRHVPSFGWDVGGNLAPSIRDGVTWSQGTEPSTQVRSRGKNPVLRPFRISLTGAENTSFSAVFCMELAMTS